MKLKVYTTSGMNSNTTWFGFNDATFRLERGTLWIKAMDGTPKAIFPPGGWSAVLFDHE